MSRPPQFLPPPFTPYETPLQPNEEPVFQAWKQVFAPHDSGEDYDLRGSIQGEGLQIGGSGKIHSYDVGNKGKIDKLLKTKGTKIAIEHLPGTGGQTVHAWPLNEKTRAIIAKGFPLYSVAPVAMLPSHKPTTRPLPPPPSIKH